MKQMTEDEIWNFRNEVVRFQHTVKQEKLEDMEIVSKMIILVEREFMSRKGKVNNEVYSSS